MLLNLTLSDRASSHGQHQMSGIVSQHNGNVVDGQESTHFLQYYG